MIMDILFIVNSLLLGVGLAMDAFSVSIADGLSDPKMGRKRMSLIAGVYAGFQFLMPVIGWFCVHTAAKHFTAFLPLVPWIALLLLLYIGGSMILDGMKAHKERIALKEKDSVAYIHEKTNADNPVSVSEDQKRNKASPGKIILQGIATSIDALSVGFTIVEYSAGMAFLAAGIIAVVTYFICMAGLLFGRRFGEHFSVKASFIGGLILIGIGLEIWIRGVFF